MSVGTIRLGAGAGFSGDRLQPAMDLIENGSLNYIVFECLAERTIALAQRRKNENSQGGYDPLLDSRMKAVLPVCRRKRTRLVSNMGAANPVAAALRTRDIAEELGLHGLRIAAISGDDVFEFVAGSNTFLLENGDPVSSLGERLVSANAYIGAHAIAQALREGADIVLAGRVADPALFVGPMIYEFGWREDDWPLLGRGIMVGHLLECAGQLTGGYFADPGYKDVPNLARLGFPFADVRDDGSATFSKLAEAGGLISLQTCKEQLLYEVHDPSAYLNPDVVADFSQVEFQLSGDGGIIASGATGRARTETLKVSLGVNEGFIGEGQITYAGSGAKARGELAIAIVREQLALQECDVEELRTDLIGVDSVMLGLEGHPEPAEVRVRVAGKTASRDQAETIVQTVEALYTNGPAGGGGVSREVRPILGITSTLIPRELVHLKVDIEVVP